MRAIIAAAAILLAVASLSRAQDTKEYSASDAAKHIGEVATITDKVASVHESKTGHILINMGGRYPNLPFTAFIPKDSADQFPRAKELEGHTVSVTGKIVLYRGKPEIVLDNASQIKKRY